MPHKNSKGKWSVPFPGSDRSVVKRSQRYFFENEKLRPIQANTYLVFPSIFFAFFVVLFSAVFLAFSKFQLGRKLLLKVLFPSRIGALDNILIEPSCNFQYPKLFSFGFASHEGPTEEQCENTHFSFTFFAEGWNKKLAEPTDAHNEKPNKRMVAKVTGKNPGYGATCISLILCGLTILTESDKMPNK